MGRPIDRAKNDEIRRLREQGVSISQIALRTGVTRAAVHQRLNRMARAAAPEAEERARVAAEQAAAAAERARWQARATELARDMAQHPENYPEERKFLGTTKRAPLNPDVLKAVGRQLMREYEREQAGMNDGDTGE